MLLDVIYLWPLTFIVQASCNTFFCEKFVREESTAEVEFCTTAQHVR